MKQKCIVQEQQQINLILEVINTLKGILSKINENIGKKQKTILLIGNTGSGKSTIFNWLSGANFNFQDDKLQLIEEKGKNFSKQGDAFESITFEPNFNVIDDDHILIDFPGFKDTKGAKNQLSIQLMFNEVVTSTEVKLAVVIEQFTPIIDDRGAGIQELVQNTFTSKNAKFDCIGLILNQFGDEDFPEDVKVEKIVKKQLEDKRISENDNIYQALQENIIILRKIYSNKSLFTKEQREFLIEQLKSIKPIQYHPDKVDQDYIVSDYIETKLNKLFVDYEVGFAKKKDEAKNKGEIDQFNNTLKQTIQEISQIKQDDLYCVIEWMKKTILINCIKDEAIKNFLEIYQFFFKYKANILGFQKLKTNTEGLKVKIQSIAQEIQADIQRIKDEEERFRQKKLQEQREHQQYLKQLREEQVNYQRQQQEDLKLRMEQKKKQEEKIAEQMKINQQKREKEENEKKARESANIKKLEDERKIEKEKILKEQQEEQVRKTNKIKKLQELATSKQNIICYQKAKEKYINEQKGIYMALLGGDWQKNYNIKIKDFDTQINEEVQKVKKIENFLINS